MSTGFVKLIFWISGVNAGASLVYFLQKETGIAILCAVIAVVCFAVFMLVSQNDQVEGATDYPGYEE